MQSAVCRLYYLFCGTTKYMDQSVKTSKTGLCLVTCVQVRVLPLIFDQFCSPRVVTLRPLCYPFITTFRINQKVVFSKYISICTFLVVFYQERKTILFSSINCQKYNFTPSKQRVNNFFPLKRERKKETCQLPLVSHNFTCKKTGGIICILPKYVNDICFMTPENLNSGRFTRSACCLP